MWTDSKYMRDARVIDQSESIRLTMVKIYGHGHMGYDQKKWLNTALISMWGFTLIGNIVKIAYKSLSNAPL